MRERYELGGISFRTLAKQYGVTERAVSQHARDEDWSGGRRWSRQKRMELGTADVKEIKELAGLLQALVGLEKAMEPPEKKQSKAAAVRVVLSGEAEELSQ